MRRGIIEEGSFDPSRLALRESLFALGNGRLGVRGQHEERRHCARRGVFLNGFHETKPIQYGEWAYGYARNHQTMLNLPDASPMELFVDGEPFDLSRGRLLSYGRRLNLLAGLVEREIEWESPAGTLVRIVSARLVAQRRPGIAAMRYEVESHGPCRVRVDSLLDASVRNRGAAEGDPRIGSHLDSDPLSVSLLSAKGSDLRFAGRTRRSGLTLAVAVAHRACVSPVGKTEGELAAASFTTELQVGSCFRLEKFASYIGGCYSNEAEAMELAGAGLEGASAAGFDTLAREQGEDMRQFWEGASLSVEGDPEVEEALTFNLFHLYQAAGRDGATNLAAKGLSGEGYEGHYFWDTEIYALPFFTHVDPSVARALLVFRIGSLDKARARAKELGLPGALFPWRTIDGEEASAYYPAGTAQFHINADIAYALVRYVKSTGDESLLLEGGAELLFETARAWMGLGFFNARRGGRFCIPCVTGPDEYTALVDNNAYTNLMAEFNLREAARSRAELAVRHPEALGDIESRIGSTADEALEWVRAADLMYLPYETSMGLLAQDDQFLDRPAWDLASTPEGEFPLLLHHHPLMIYRKRVLKQPDAVLAMLLRHERFGLADKMRAFRYYEGLTTCDSSLAHSVQCVAAAECGLEKNAYEHFRKTVRMDLDDVHGNSSDGLHIAAMAGSWISLAQGFAGLRESEAGMSFQPRLPAPWTSFSLRLRSRGRLIECRFERGVSKYRLLEGEGLQISHEGKPLLLGPGEEIAIDEVPRPLAWIFDLDGVLVNSAELHFRAWSRLAVELGIPFGRAENEAFKGVPRMECLRLLLGPKVSSMGSRELDALAERKNDYYRESLKGLGPEAVLEGMREALSTLRAAGRTLVLASSSRNAPEILERTGIKDYFGLIVDPSRIVMPKPDPEIFIAASEMAGARLKDCIGIEDAQAGIDALRAAGIFCVGIGGELSGADVGLPGTSSFNVAVVEKAFHRASAAFHSRVVDSAS